ncbi:MAG: NAD(+)/NADH kinase [Pseudomonadales bacterium]|nr:NAD(+)/NADH kinase [Pseudomonadales bacterium]
MIGENTKNRRLKIGFLVNPYAGIGGEAALKGSDGELIRAKALAYSDKRRSSDRVRAFFTALDKACDDIAWVTAAGPMGEDLFIDADIKPLLCVGDYGLAGSETEAKHTIEAAGLFMDQAVDLLILVGGDGTARNIVDALAIKGQNFLNFPCLGLPSGVKMQSAVFALSPYAAAEVVKSMLHNRLTHVSEQDVRDIDEAALREGRVLSQYYGGLFVPAEPRFMQNLKQGGQESDALVLDDIAEQLDELLDDEPDAIFLLGPGSTTAFYMQRLGLPNTLVGFDALEAGRVIACDLNSDAILALLKTAKKVFVVLSPTGHQGFLLGRGNQQLNVAVLTQLDKSQIIVIASKAKLLALDNRPLIVDCNDVALDQKFSGFIPVITAFNDRVLYPVKNCY